MARCFAYWITALLLGAGWAGGCAGQPEPGSAPPDLETPLAAPEAGVPVAKVGESLLSSADVEPMAAAAGRLRFELLGVRPKVDTWQERKALAVEWLALAERSRLTRSSQVVDREAYRRALAQAYLERMMAPLDDAPVSDGDLAAAHRRQIEEFLARGESELYEPSRMDVAIIGIGAYPDWKPRAGSQSEPMLDQAGIERVATEIKQACGDRVRDLDAFLAIGRRFSQGNPTVRIEFKNWVALDPALSVLPPAVHAVAVGLDGNGAVGPVVWLPGLALVVRRGPTYPGRGEDPAAIRDELVSAVRLERKRRKLESLLTRLTSSLTIVTWPEHLVATGDGQPGS